MGFNAKVGQFTKKNTTGTQSITGVGFEPKALLFWGTPLTADGVLATGYNLTFGFKSATESFAMGFGMKLSTYGQSVAIRSDYNYFLKKGTANVGTASTASSSLDADGFTLNWVISDVNEYLINYLALGGTDLTNIKEVNFLTGTTLGNLAVTGVGFQPDSIILFSSGSTSTAPAFVGPTVSFISSIGTEYTSFQLTTTAGNGANVQKNKAYSFCDNSTTITAEASIVSFDADGFTLNLSTATNSVRIYAICLKGIQAKSGVFNQPTTTGNQSISGLGFQPSALIVAGVGDPTTATPVTNTKSQFCFGAATSSAQMAAITANHDSTTAINTYLSSSNIIQHSDVSSPFSILSSASLNSLDSGGFTLNWGVADSIQREIIYMALGATSTPPPAASNPGAFFSFF